MQARLKFVIRAGLGREIEAVLHLISDNEVLVTVSDRREQLS